MPQSLPAGRRRPPATEEPVSRDQCLTATNRPAAESGALPEEILRPPPCRNYRSYYPETAPEDSAPPGGAPPLLAGHPDTHARNQRCSCNRCPPVRAHT